MDFFRAVQFDKTVYLSIAIHDCPKICCRNNPEISLSGICVFIIPLKAILGNENLACACRRIGDMPDFDEEIAFSPSFRIILKAL
jgi:hypothetical protein